MKGVLGKYRLKDDSSSYGGSSHVSILQQKIEEISDKLEKLKTALVEAEAKSGVNKAGNVESLVQKIEEEKTKLDDYIEKSQSETLMNKDIPAKDALDELSKLKKKYDETWKKIQKYQRYEEILQVEHVAIPQAAIFDAKYTKRVTIWTNREEFEKLRREWYYENFLKQDAEAIVKVVNGYDV